MRQGRTPVRRRATAAAVLAVGTVVVLSGCGVAEPGVQPGLAARVGDREISLDDADDDAGAVCEMVATLVEEGASQVTARASVRDEVVRLLVLREVGEQLAEENDLTPGESYAAARENYESQLSDLDVDQDVVDVAVRVFSGWDYFTDIAQQLGEAGTAGAEGAEGEEAGAAVQAEGLRVAREWEVEHGIEVNPLFSDISIGEDDVTETTRRDLSVAVSDEARAAAEAAAPASPGAPPDTSYAASLPESQRCG